MDPTSHKSSSLITDLGLVFSTLIWGSTFYVVKNALEHIHPIPLVAYRFLVASAVMLPFLLGRKDLRKGWKGGMGIGIILWFCFMPQTIGLLYTTASNSGFITGLFVIFVPILMFIVDRKVPRVEEGVAIALSLVGLWVLTGGISQANRGDFLTLITAVAVAGHIYFASKLIRADSDPYVLAFQQFVVVMVLSFLSAALFQIPLTIPTLKTSGVVVLLAFFPTLTCILIQLHAQKTVSTVKVALIFTLEPVFAALFSWTLGGEPFVMNRAIGGLLIFLSMVISEVRIFTFVRKA